MRFLKSLNTYSKVFANKPEAFWFKCIQPLLRLEVSNFELLIMLVAKLLSSQLIITEKVS